MKFSFVKRCYYSKYPVQQYVGKLEFDELTLDLYYKEGKEIGSV
jgi:alpha-glucosidase